MLLQSRQKNGQGIKVPDVEKHGMMRADAVLKRRRLFFLKSCAFPSRYIFCSLQHATEKITLLTDRLCPGWLPRQQRCPRGSVRNPILDGELMFEPDLPCPYSIIPAKTDEAVFVTKLYWQNIESLHGKPISLDEWKAVLSSNDEDEQNFLVCRGCMPVAWLRMNGLLNKDMAWISMLVVSDKHHRQGIGGYTGEFSEKFVKEKGFRKLGVHIAEDKIPAQNLYKNVGMLLRNTVNAQPGTELGVWDILL